MWRNAAEFFKRAGSVAFVAAICLGVYILGLCKFDGQERVYYLNTPSSQAAMKEGLCFSEIFAVEGQSVVYYLDESNFVGCADDLAACILQEAGGKICFSEEVDGILSHYCYSPFLGGGVILEGYLVNMHVAISADRVAVGTPVIFGGY